MSNSRDNFSRFIETLANTAECSVVSGGITPVSAGTSTGWRTMPWFMTTYLEDGIGHLETESGVVADYGEHVLDGQVCCLAPGVPHQLTTIKSGVSWWSHMSFVVMGGLALTEFVDLPHIVSGASAQKIKEINGELAGIDKAPLLEIALLLKKRALVFEMAALLASLGTVRRDRQGIVESAERLQPVLSYIDAHLNEDLCRERLARLASLSPSRFYAVFHGAVGVGPNVYVQRRRMERAQKLLIRTTMSISEISGMCGYENPFLFSRVFKKFHELSPLQYRQRVQIASP
ncbi:MAG: AraC family transcriptional regulator [Capsulimonadaceae bacterium]|nr:AraC family transcriptional regulator [Capsulimonadaceae bacterium]